MASKRDFSLSYFLDQQTRGVKAPAYAAADMLAVLKALKSSDNHTGRLLGIARASQLKIAACQEILEGLEREGLVTIEPDNETGNDKVTLTKKGVELI